MGNNRASFTGIDPMLMVRTRPACARLFINNTPVANCKGLFNTQRCASSDYVQGGSFWNIRYNSSVVVDGEGTQKDYWSYELVIEAGVITDPTGNATHC